jgi:lactoylglutathione lyase
MHLYETHLAVTDTNASQTFYTEVVGLRFAYRDPTRDIIFLWVEDNEKGMIGLWGPSTGYGRHNAVITPSHVAFEIAFEDLQCAIATLNKRGIETSGFSGKPATEPSVIGWMPSAQIYFRDPDGHSLEFIAILSDAPAPGFIGSYSEWLNLKKINSSDPTERSR